MTPAFIGEQVAVDNCVHFNVRTLQPFGVKMVVARVNITPENSFPLIEDILSNTKLIPLETREYSLFDIQQQLSRDAMNGFGIHYPEFGIVASHSNSIMDKPIAKVVKDGKEIYIPAPDIRNRIRRFVPKEAA